MELNQCRNGKKRVAENDGNDTENEIERSKMGIMRALIEREDPSSKEVDDLTIRRFLRAREMDEEKGCTMLLNCLRWRRAFVPNGFICESEIPNQLAKNKLCLQGVDKKGRLILVGFGNRHKPTDGTLDEFKRFAVYCLDKISAKLPKEQEKFVCIADFEGWGYSNSDVRAYRAILSILQDCFPERLGKLYIVHSHYIFMTMWKVIYPFIDSNTRKKITFIDNKKLKSTLLEDIDESQLPQIYGGKLPLVPIQHC